MISSEVQRKNDLKIARWLIFVAAVIFMMILLGGSTRLTHSGLSMVDWKPIMGVIPPISESEWQESFLKYQSFPEYQKKNIGMNLTEYQSIFYFEYLHRLLGRLIGLLFFIPFMFYWLRGVIRKPMLPQMITMFILGGFQGLLGWYMVKSGLVNDPHVSQYRLTAHLIAAIAIYSYILWVAFGLIKNHSRSSQQEMSTFFRYSKYLVGLIVIMIISGGFVAGTKAGFAFNTFPLMAGQLVPDGMYSLNPFWLNWFENITTVQFNHRLIATLLLLIIPVFLYKLYQSTTLTHVRFVVLLIFMMLLLQITLGISTLILHVPVPLAVSHQGGAVLLLSLFIYLTRQLKRDE